MLSPLLYTLYTCDCTPAHTSNTVVKFTKDTTVVGPVSDGDGSVFQDEMTAVSMVYGKQPGPEDHQEQGSDHQLQEEQN